MTLNKITSYVLLHILNGKTTVSAIGEQLPDVTIRSIQRALVRLHEMGIVEKEGSNHPTYAINYTSVLKQTIADKLLENDGRPISNFNHRLITWLDSLTQQKLDELFGDDTIQESDTQMSAKELEHLTIELSWKSSALEGNTYTLLDTQLLLAEGIKAKNRTEFETQMILNHKNAIAFIVQNGDLFRSNLVFSSVEELHRIIGYNLGIERGIRKKLVKITTSNYEPLANPHQLREYSDRMLGIINRAANPFAKALLALALLPYLQAFEDGNKRTGRMLANALLIHSIGRGFSLRKTDARSLALGYLAFYEFNSLRSLSKILKNELD